MWLTIVLSTLLGATSSVTFAEALAVDAPAAVAADHSARAFADGAAGLRPIDALHFEVQPGGQFQPTTRAWTSPALQLVAEATVSWAGVSGARRGTVTSEGDVAVADAAVVRHLRRLAVAAAWCECRAAERDEAAAAEVVVDAVAVAASLQRISETGAVTADDIGEANAWVADARLQALDAEALRLEAALRLGRLLGTGGAVTTNGPLPEPAELVVAGLDGRFDVEVVRAERVVVALRAGLHEHELRQLPTAAVAVTSQIDDPTTGFVYGRLGITLPNLDGDVVGRATATGHLRRAEAELQEQQRAQVERLAAAVHEVEHQSEARALIDEQLLPALRERRRLAERRQAMGDGVVFELVRAARSVHDATRRSMRAEVQQRHAAIALHLQAPTRSTSTTSTTSPTATTTEGPLR